MTKDELILPEKYISSTLMAMGWGTKGFLGSQGPYFGPIGNIELFNDFFHQSWLQMSQNELILTGKYFSPALMSMGWGPKGFLGSQGPYFGTIGNIELFNDFFIKVGCRWAYMSWFWLVNIFHQPWCPWGGAQRGSWGPKGPILFPLGTMSFFMTFSSNLVADKPKWVNFDWKWSLVLSIKLSVLCRFLKKTTKDT